VDHIFYCRYMDNPFTSSQLIVNQWYNVHMSFPFDFILNALWGSSSHYTFCGLLFIVRGKRAVSLVRFFKSLPPFLISRLSDFSSPYYRINTPKYPAVCLFSLLAVIIKITECSYIVHFLNHKLKC